MSNEGFEQGGDLLLLAPGKLRGGLEKSAHLTENWGQASDLAIFRATLREDSCEANKITCLLQPF